MGTRLLPLAILGLLVAASHTPTGATSLVCPEFKRTTYASAAFVVLPHELPKLRQQLASWGPAHGLEVGDIDTSILPPSRRPAISVFMSPEPHTVLITVKAVNGANKVVSRIENDCRHPRADWLPYWRPLVRQLSKWGYSLSK
jgi:hypothetical protein